MRPITDNGTRLRRLGLLTAVTAITLVISPLAAHADRDVTFKLGPITLQPAQRICIDDDGIKAVAKGKATARGAYFQLRFDNVTQEGGPKNAVTAFEQSAANGFGTYKVCAHNPSEATEATDVTLELVVTHSDRAVAPQPRQP